MKPFEWLEEYINDKQKYIDAILENKKEDGICYISKKEIAEKTGKSISTIRNKINAINRDELIINNIGKDAIIIKNENFKNSQTVKNYLKLLQYFSIKGNYEKNENIIQDETGLSYKIVHFFKSQIPNDIRKILKEETL